MIFVSQCKGGGNRRLPESVFLVARPATTANAADGRLYLLPGLPK